MKEVWTYLITRDSVHGELKSTCHLWYVKPMRTRISGRVTWVCSDIHNPGYLGQFSVEDITAWFGAERVPETDLMMIKVEQGVTPKMIEEAQKR